jgi:MoaA/NifB/PqqE/SkfB family radical SAM enzyme
MILENFKSLLLEKKYNIKGFIDIADLSTGPGKAISFFDPLYQPEYQNDDRIIIYTSREISNEFLAHLYQTTDFLDISNWFVLICSPRDIQNQLETVSRSATTDSSPFQCMKVDLDPTALIENNYSLPDTICAIPWLNIGIKSDGVIFPCCVSNDVYGNIKTDNLSEVFQGAKAFEIRQEFLEGKRPTGCSSCWVKEDQGLSSARTHNAKRLKKDFLTKYLEQPTIASCDLKFQNTCNFKCRICSSESSSLFAQEESKFKSIPLTPQLNWSEDISFINQINQLLPDIKNIDMYGGEPFLIKKFVNVLETAVNKGYAKDIRLHYNTNGSVWPEKFIPYWKQFNHVDIHFSIDAVGKRFELQRGGSWQDVESNILRLKNLNLPNMSFSIMPTISIMNVYYIDEVVDWAEKHNFQVFVGYVLNPSEYGLQNLTKEAQLLILQKFQNYHWPEMRNILETIRSSKPEDNKKFVETTKWFDQIRQENFAESHHEIAKAMGYVYNN